MLGGILQIGIERPGVRMSGGPGGPIPIYPFAPNKPNCPRFWARNAGGLKKQTQFPGVSRARMVAAGARLDPIACGEVRREGSVGRKGLTGVAADGIIPVPGGSRGRRERASKGRAMTREEQPKGEEPTPAGAGAQDAGPGQEARGKRPKRWYERTSVTLCVAAGLLVVALGFVHIITGVESPYQLPVDIVRKAAFGYRETFINACAIRALPYHAAKIKYPVGCAVLQRRGYLPSGHTFEARMAIGQLQRIERWRVDFERTLGRSERPWQERLQTPEAKGQDRVEGAFADNAQGIDLARDGDYAAALAAFGRAIRKAPACAEAFYNRALVSVALGNLGQGADDLGAVVEIRPGFVEGHLERGRLYLRMARYNEAVDVFSCVIEMDETHAEAHFGLALACYAQGRYDRARQGLRRLLDLGVSVPLGFLGALRDASGIDPGTSRRVDRQAGRDAQYCNRRGYVAPRPGRRTRRET